MSRKLSQNEFIEKATTIHGDAYNYEFVNYIDSSTKIILTCNKHNYTFTITPNNFLKGSGCKHCGKEKQKMSCLKNHGVEYPGQSVNIKEKIKKTNLDKYGAENPFGNKDIKEKIKKTNLDKYGVENPAQSKEIYDKVKNTNLERYGVETTLLNIDTQEKIKQTMYEKYGSKYPRQGHMIDIIHLIEDKEWLFEQYIVLGKTTQQISHDLGINSTTICNYLHKHEIEIKYTVGYSRKAIQWLESIMAQEQIFIQHAGNSGEYKIPNTRYRVDGYCEATNTIYEFHGDCFHGNPDLFEDHEQCQPFNDLTAKELYDKTIERESEIISLGYNLITMWENDFNKQEIYERNVRQIKKK